MSQSLKVTLKHAIHYAQQHGNGMEIDLAGRVVGHTFLAELGQVPDIPLLAVECSRAFPNLFR